MTSRRHRDGVCGRRRPAPDASLRGIESNRTVPSASSSTAARPSSSPSGGIGGNHDLVRANWPAATGGPARRPADRCPGLRRRPHAGDHRGGGRRGRQPRPDVALRRGRAQLGPRLAGARDPHPARDRARCGSTARGNRLPAPFLPGFDTLGTLGPLAAHRFRPLLVRPQPVPRRQGVRAVGVGAEPRPHPAALPRCAPAARSRKVTPSVQAFLDHGEDWLTAATIGELVAKMNALTPYKAPPLDPAKIERQVVERDRQVETPLHQGRPGRRDPGGADPTVATS